MKEDNSDALDRADHASDTIDRAYGDSGDNDYHNWRSFNE